MVKRLFKRKKRKKTKAEVRMGLRKEFLAKAQELEKTLSASGDPESNLTALANLIRDFLREFFNIKYQPTNQELISELEKRKLKKGISKEVVRFLQGLTMMRYSPTRNITTQVVKKKIGIFMVLIDTVYEAISEENAKKEKKQLPLIAKPKEIFRNFTAGAEIVGRWSKHGWELASRRLAEFGFQTSKVGAEYVMEQLAKGYDALEDEKLRQAEKCLERIERKLESFTLEDQKVVEAELMAFKRELSFSIVKPRPNVPLSSIPDVAKSKAKPQEKAERPTDEALDVKELERFVRLALSQKVSSSVIRRRLLQNGWSAFRINKVFRKFSVTEKPEDIGEEEADELELFVQQAVKNNIPPAIIRKKLLKDGWPASKIDAALSRFSSTKGKKGKKKTKTELNKKSSGDDLEQFILQAMKKKILPVIIKKKLLKDGWPSSKVNTTIKKCSSKA